MRLRYAVQYWKAMYTMETEKLEDMMQRGMFDEAVELGTSPFAGCTDSERVGTPWGVMEIGATEKYNLQRLTGSNLSVYVKYILVVGRFKGMHAI